MSEKVSFAFCSVWNVSCVNRAVELALRAFRDASDAGRLAVPRSRCCASRYLELSVNLAVLPLRALRALFDGR